MVYEGRPSRGCRTCKSRRIKCDETRPACNHCIKTKRVCPGFPNELDLIFRPQDPGNRQRRKKRTENSSSDEEATPRARRERPSSEDGEVVGNEFIVVECDQVDEYIPRPRLSLRVKALAPKKGHADTGSPNEDGCDPSFTNLESWITVSEFDLASQMLFNPAIEEQAKTFFFNNFVVKHRSEATTQGFLGMLEPILQEAGEGSALDLATQAVAMATLAQWSGQTQLMPRAQALYTRALVCVQRDIEYPLLALSDATLLTVLMFSMYESTTSSSDSVQAWARHIDGAVTLVQARGTQQFEAAQSLQLFRAVRTQMLTNSIQQRRTVPEFPGPRGWMSDMRVEKTAASSLIEFSVQLPNLLAREKAILAREQTDENMIEVTALLLEAYRLQEALTLWESEMPTQWSHRSVANVASPSPLDQVEELETWPGVVHIYEDVHVACIRNNNRVAQILCSSVVIDAIKWLEPLSFTMDPQYAMTKTRVQSLVDDICYSVPFHLYGHSAVEKIASDRSDSSKIHTPNQALGGYFLIWPLFAASSLTDIWPIQRRWLRGRLGFIAHHYGLDGKGLISSINKGRSGANWSERLEIARCTLAGSKYVPWKSDKLSPDCGAVREADCGLDSFAAGLTAWEQRMGDYDQSKEMEPIVGV